MSPTYPDAVATATELSQSTWPVKTNQSATSLGDEKTVHYLGQDRMGGTFATGFTHTTGNTAALTEATTYTSGGLYTVAWTVTGRTAGAFTHGCNGWDNSGIDYSYRVDGTEIHGYHGYGRCYYKQNESF